MLLRAQVYGTPKLSPNGRWLATSVAGPQYNVYIYDTASGRETKLTLEGNNRYPVWTPDGKRVTFSSDREGEGKWSLFWKRVDGSDKAQLLYSGEYSVYPYSWSPDGRLLTFQQAHPATSSDIWVLPLEGDREPELIVGTEFADTQSAFSLNGRWIAYTSDKDGKFQVYVQPYPAMDRVEQVSDDFGEEPIWSPRAMSCSTATATNGW